MMDDDLEKSIEMRCDLLLQKSKAYTELQGELADAHESNDIEAFSKISFQMQRIAIVSCYKLAIKDLHSIEKE